MSELSGTKKENIRQSEDYKATKPILEGFLTRITKTRSKISVTFPPEYIYATRYGTFKHNCIVLKERWEETKSVSRLFRDLKTTEELEKLPARMKSMIKMLAYLGLVESLGVVLADMVLILLIANDREVHTQRSITKHVTKVEELRRIDLYYKLAFLKKENLGIFGTFIDRDLRNDIAHLKFTIQGDGAIEKKDSRQNRIDIDSKILEFWNGVDTLRCVFEDIGFLQWFEQRQKKE